MTDTPLHWRDVNLSKRHFVGSCVTEEGNRIITSRWWNRRKQRWAYVAETLDDVRFQLRITGQEKARTV
jgi:hypothetical protein